MQNGSDAATFVERFDAGWGSGRDGFFEHFLPALVDEDVRLHQPLLPVARGHAGFREFFEPLFAAMPDLRGEVLDWSPAPDGVEIELVLHGTLADLPVEIVTRDRITLRDGRILERRAQLNPLPLLVAALRRPRTGVPVLLGPLGRRVGGVDRALAALAVGRIALGAPSRVAPRGMARAFGAGRAANPELDYMTRVFGVRAVALGLGYLTSGGAARRRWQRLALMCDVSDTLAGVGHLRRRDLPRASALATTALTGAYALVGAAAVLRDAAR